jgi:hypothetical protein
LPHFCTVRSETSSSELLPSLLQGKGGERYGWQQQQQQQKQETTAAVSGAHVR